MSIQMVGYCVAIKSRVEEHFDSKAKYFLNIKKVIKMAYIM